MAGIDSLRPLLEAAVEGDNVALGELIRRTQPDVWKLCVALGSRGEEEDLVQETYLRAIAAAATFRGEAPVRAWLLSIGRNVCADHVRKRQRQRRLLERLLPLASDSVVPPGERIDDLLAGLDVDRREAFVLTQMLGLSYEETAVVLDCPIGTIRSRVARARTDLIEVVRRSDAV